MLRWYGYYEFAYAPLCIGLKDAIVGAVEGCHLEKRVYLERKLLKRATCVKLFFLHNIVIKGVWWRV